MPKIRNAKQLAIFSKPIGRAGYEALGEVEPLLTVIEPPQKCSEIVVFKVQRKRMPLLIPQLLDVCAVALLVLE